MGRVCSLPSSSIWAVICDVRLSWSLAQALPTRETTRPRAPPPLHSSDAAPPRASGATESRAPPPACERSTSSSMGRVPTHAVKRVCSLSSAHGALLKLTESGLGQLVARVGRDAPVQVRAHRIEPLRQTSFRAFRTRSKSAATRYRSVSLSVAVTQLRQRGRPDDRYRSEVDRTLRRTRRVEARESALRSQRGSSSVAAVSVSDCRA